MEAETNHDLSINSRLPPGVKEYLSTYNNEEIASKIILKSEKDIILPQNVTMKGNNVVETDKTTKDNGEHMISTKTTYEKYVSVEQPSFKILGFEFAPIFILLLGTLANIVVPVEVLSPIIVYIL